jgi:hypothetical protein
MVLMLTIMADWIVMPCRWQNSVKQSATSSSRRTVHFRTVGSLARLMTAAAAIAFRQVHD